MNEFRNVSTQYNATENTVMQHDLNSSKIYDINETITITNIYRGFSQKRLFKVKLDGLRQ